jgi:hypothetical protein
MEVCGQLNAPAAYSPAKGYGTYWIRDGVSHRDGLDVVTKRKRNLSHAGNRTTVIQLSGQSLY